MSDDRNKPAVYSKIGSVFLHSMENKMILDWRWNKEELKEELEECRKDPVQQTDRRSVNQFVLGAIFGTVKTILSTNYLKSIISQASKLNAQAEL